MAPGESGSGGNRLCALLLRQAPPACSAVHARMVAKKAHLVVRLMDEQLGRELMVQALGKMLAEAAEETLTVDNGTFRVRRFLKNLIKIR